MNESDLSECTSYSPMTTTRGEPSRHGQKAGHSDVNFSWSRQLEKGNAGKRFGKCVYTYIQDRNGRQKACINQGNGHILVLLITQVSHFVEASRVLLFLTDITDSWGLSKVTKRGTRIGSPHNNPNLFPFTPSHIKSLGHGSTIDESSSV